MGELVKYFQFCVTLDNPCTVASITTDGHFLYVLYPASGNLVKLGTGEGGTVRGFCYTQSTAHFEPGFIAWASGALFYRKHPVDVISDSKQSSGQQQQAKSSPFCHRIDHNTLQVSTSEYIVINRTHHTCKLYVMRTKVIVILLHC